MIVWKNFASAIVAGHLCLDIIPQFDPNIFFDFKTQFQPGSLTRVGPAIFSTGGAVSNTGLVLHKLGIPTTLVGKIGADYYGQAVEQILLRYGDDLIRGIRVDASAATSYTVVINPPGIDRFFLHCPGPNDTFCSQDIPLDQVAAGRSVPFRLSADNEADLSRTRRRADPDIPADQSDRCNHLAGYGHARPGRRLGSGRLGRSFEVPPYRRWIFSSPAWMSCYSCWNRPAFEHFQSTIGIRAMLLENPSLLTRLGDQLLEMGAKIVLLKLGDCGAYLRTADAGVLSKLGRARPDDLDSWSNRELWAPCFRVRVVGTTGSGDSTIAGFPERVAARPVPRTGAYQRCGSRRLQRRSSRRLERGACLGRSSGTHCSRLG